MDNVVYGDFTSSIRYTLVSRHTPDQRVEIDLDLFRGSVHALRTTIAEVERRVARTVMARCQRHLERLGVHAVTNLSPPTCQDVDVTPLAAFDWVFEAG